MLPLLLQRRRRRRRQLSTSGTFAQGETETKTGFYSKGGNPREKGSSKQNFEKNDFRGFFPPEPGILNLFRSRVTTSTSNIFSRAGGRFDEYWRTCKLKIHACNCEEIHAVFG